MHRNSIALALLGLGLIIIGCGEPMPEQMHETTFGAVTGPNIRVLPIKSDKYYYADRGSEVRTKLETEINGGQRNIVAVRTWYTAGLLGSGEIIYDASGNGDGNKIRVLFIHSDKHYGNDQREENQLKLNETINSGKYDIVKIQTEDYLHNAEVYYRLK